MALPFGAPDPRFVLADDGTRIATYDAGDPDADVVLAVHGFASNAVGNWFASGWARDLVRAGRRVVAIDQRGHGASGKPVDPAGYSVERLVADVLAVLDAYVIDEAALLGYSLGARVGWQAAIALPTRVPRAVLGGIPGGDPLVRFRLDEARAFAADRTPVEDALTRTYVEMAAGVRGNDLEGS